MAARLISDVERIEEPSAARRLWRRLRAVFFGAATVLIVLEGIVRIIGFAPAIDRRNGWMEQAPGIPYRPRPNSVIAGRARTGEYTYLHRHNSAGLRDVEHELIKPEGTFRILGLGDSFTAGWGADFEQTYLRRVEVALNARDGEHPEIEIVKAGINGYFPETQRLLLENHGLRYRPDLVLVGFTPNDVYDTWMGKDAVVVSKEGWLTSRDATALGGLGTWLYVHSHVARIPLAKIAGKKRALFLEGDWATTIYRPDAEAEQAWQRVLDEYDRMDRAIRQAGATLVLFYIPSDPPLTTMHAYPEERLRAWAESRGIEVVSALAELRAAAGTEPLYWPKDGHCTPAGYGILADVLARELDARGLVP